MKNILVIILISIIFCACTSTKYVEVPVPQIRTEYRDRTLRDTVYNSDSIIIKEHGDTVF